MINWTNCLRTHDHVRAEWAGEHGLSDLAESELRRAPRRGLRAPRGERRLQRPERAAPAPARRPARRSATTSGAITRNADRERYDARIGRVHGLRRPVGLEAVDREDLPGRRPGQRRRDPRRRRARRGCWSRTAAPPGSRPSGSTPGAAAGNGAATRLEVRAPVVVVACGRDRVAGAAAALGDRRPGGRRLPAPAPDGRRHRLLRGAAELDVGAAAGRALAPVRRPRRGLRLPDRVGAGDDRPVRRRDPVALGRRPQAADARVGARGAADRAGPRARPRPGRDRRRRQRASSTIRSTTSSTVRTCGMGVEQLVRIHEAAGAREIVGSGMRAPDWTRGDDLEAVHRRAQRARDRPPRVRHLLGPPDGHLPDGPRPGRPRSPTRGASCTTRRGSGSATPRPSRAPRGPTRWRRSWRWRGAPRTRSRQAERR